MRASRYRGLAQAIFEARDDHAALARVLNNDGATAYFAGRWDEAVDLYERSADAARRIGDVVGAALTQANIAEIRCDQNRLDEASALLEEALAVWRAAGYGLGVGFATGVNGRVAMRSGDFPAARAHFAVAREQLNAVGAASLVLEIDAHVTQCELFAGNAGEVLRRLGRIRERAVELGAAPNFLSGLQRLAGDAKRLTGDPDGARARLEEALALARSVDARYEEGLALLALGRLGDSDAARLGRALLDGLGVREASLVPRIRS